MKHPLNVFIDTNIFQGKKFDVENETLKIFKRYIDIGIINYYTHKIILAECKGHISSGVKKIVSDLFLSKNKILNKECISRQMLEKTGLKEVVLLKDRDTSEIRDKCLELFSQYISSLNPNTISSSGVDVEQIINDYRDRKFPFEEGKNEEFKDAIMISSIKQFFKENECTIVTSDKGFRRAFDGLKNFHIFCDLEELFNFINKNNGSEVYEFVRDNKEIEKYLREQIENFSSIEVENAEYDRKGCPDDYEFDDYEIDEINVKSIDEPKILETLEDKARLSCRCVVEFSVRGEVIDYPSAIWDSEEHRYIDLPTTEYHDKYKVNVIVNFTVIFAEDKAEFSEFKTDDDILLNRYNRTQREKREIGYPYEDDLYDFE